VEKLERVAFILGQHLFRTGLPGERHAGVSPRDSGMDTDHRRPTEGPKRYSTGQFGKHHLGDPGVQVFIYPPSFKLKQLSDESAVRRERKLYVIRNARLDPEWTQVERRTLPIAARAISSLIQNQGRGDLVTIYYLSQRDGLDFNLAYIPKTFDEPHREEFDMEYMRKLFNVGYTSAVNGYPWEKAPPGLDITGDEGQGHRT